jgi:hypothetical protein
MTRRLAQVRHGKREVSAKTASVVFSATLGKKRHWGPRDSSLGHELQRPGPGNIASL